MEKERVSNNNKMNLGGLKGFRHELRVRRAFFFFIFSLLFAICYFACIPFEGSIDEVKKKAGVGKNNGNNNTALLVGIEITSPPNKISYNIGDALDLRGLIVTAFYDGDISKTITAYTHSGFNSVTAGSKTITISYQGRTAQFTVMVNPPGKTLTTIAIITNPAKTTYNIGEDLNTSNLVVRAYYSDSSENVIPINELVFSGFDSGTGGSKEVAISYGGKTTSFMVTVNARIFTITFNSNGGDTEAVPASMTVTEALPAPVLGSLPVEPARKTYTFKGWNTQADGNGTVFTETTTVADNITVYAQWAIEMVQIPAGNFLMGSPSSETGRLDREGPQRQVTLIAFKMGKYQVTQEQWQAVMTGNDNNISATPSYFNGGSGREPLGEEVQASRPVEQVSWYDTLVFCNKLSVAEGLTPAYSILDSVNPDDWGTVPSSSNAAWNAVTVVTGSTGFRLPTEAQWEYACRAGTTTAFNDGVTQDWNDSTVIELLGWYSSNCFSRTHEVGKKAPNNWGLYDMHGNVWEWCWDWLTSNYPSSAETNPVGMSSGSTRVDRGGSWNTNALFVRSAFRGDTDPSYGIGDQNRYLGFRLVRPE